MPELNAYDEFMRFIQEVERATGLPQSVLMRPSTFESMGGDLEPLGPKPDCKATILLKRGEKPRWECVDA